MNYDEFQEVMGNWPQYLWEPIEVTTSDGYILTLFHVWNQATRDAATKGPVIFQHGNTMDATSWLSLMTWGHASFLQMADLGHDLYFGNNRGTRYSQQHTSLDVISDAEQFWNFSLEDLAQDVLANVEAMYDSAGSGLKGWYFGYSKGTIQMLIALMNHEDTIDTYLNRAVLMAPCTITGESVEPDLSENVMNSVSSARDAGIQAFFGPTWDEDLETICENIGFFGCRRLKRIETEPFGAKETEHFQQNRLANKFQAFVEDWAYPDNYTFEGAEYDLSTIQKVPVSLMVAENDKVCTKKRADELADQLSTLQTYYTIADQDHGIFSYAVSEKFTEMISNELTDVALGYQAQTVDIWEGAAALGPQAALVAIALTTLQLFH